MTRNVLAPALGSALFLACALLFAQSTGCGGGGGGGSGTSGGAFLTPRVVSVSPSDNALEISVFSKEIVAVFSADMDPSTINTNTVVVRAKTSGAFITGTVAYDTALRTATWTLTQTGLNPSFPTQANFAFDTVYTVEYTSGIKANGLPIVPTVLSQFKTAATQFGLDPAGTSPLPGATGVLIDPFRTLVNGSLVFATLKVKIDVDLNPASISSSTVLLRSGGLSGPTMTAGVGFDTASKTIYMAPLGAGNPNPAFPGEPLLQTATAYTIEVTTAVQDSNGNSPASPVFISFNTIACAIRPPALGGADLLLAEAFAGPSATNPATDSNGNGTAETGNDEFVEIVNVSSDYLNLIGHKYADSGNIAANPPLLVLTATAFPAIASAVPIPQGERHMTLLAPGHAIVIWNGPAPAGGQVIGVPAGIPFDKVMLGRSKAFFAGRFSGGMLANAGDTAIMQRLDPGLGSGHVLNTTFTTSGSEPASAVLDGGTPAAYVNHFTFTSGARRFSPGFKTNGSAYP